MDRSRVRSADVGITPRSVTRRDALRLFIGAGLCATFLPGLASAESTQEKLDAARSDYDAAAAELERIAQEYEAIAGQLASTTAQVDDLTAQIDAKQEEIDAKQEEIDAKQEEIDEKQEVLAERMSSAYKAGSTSTLDLLLSSATFEELTSNIYYLDKISESDRAMIDEIRTLKAALEQERANLEQQKAELEDQRSELEELQAQQQSQLEQARAKQQESQELVDSLDAEVQELVAQRDKELAAAQQAAQEANKNQSTGGSTAVVGHGSLADLVSAAYSTPSPGSGLCAAWVNNVFRRAGVGSFYGNADDLYYAYCGYAVSSIRPGMIIAVNTAPYSWAAQIYGHVGIYLGNNVVRDNASGVLRNSTLDAWVAEYSVTTTVRCGWHGGIALS